MLRECCAKETVTSGIRGSEFRQRICHVYNKEARADHQAATSYLSMSEL